MRSRTVSIVATLALAALWMMAEAGATAMAGPFSGMAGSWSGGGKLTTTDGNSERLRCRANNSVGSSGNTINISIRCASDSYKIDLSGYAANSNGRISGQWSEPNYNSAGTLSGRAGHNSINAMAIGNTISARLSMRGTGNHMSVTIQPEGTGVRHVSLSFRKR